jgi:asparagine synthetase B (glutamine-hydrolysing)
VTRAQLEVFHLSLEFRTGAAVRPAERLNLTINKIFDVGRHDDEFGTTAIWGTPALNGRILTASEIARRVRQDSLEALVSRLDCGFLLVIHDLRADRLHVVTDRMASLPLFHHMGADRFLASSSFKSLFDRRGARTSSGFDPWTVAEFFYFRRVFNTRTYDRGIAFLPYASIYTVEGHGATHHRRYWRIGADKLDINQDALAERLADELQHSMRTYTSDKRRFGILLSGGLDARAILAAAPKPLVCFTTTPKPNNELAVATELAGIRHAEHVYIPRPERMLNDALRPSVMLSGGMTIFSEVPFLGYGDQILPKADTIFMGLMLDVMFCGHYLPKSLATYGGRSGWHFRLHELPDDIAPAFVDSISYRLKTTDPMRVISPKHRDALRKKLIERVRQEIDEGRELNLRGYDLWEFVHLHNLARHYSLLMAQSVRTFAACRLPALTNALYDLCWSMRAEDKSNWAVYQNAISRLNPDMMQVRNANTNIRADMPLRRQTFVKFARALSNRALGISSSAAPSWWDRSWPEPRQAIDVNPNIRAAVENLSTSEHIAATGLYDLAEIQRVVDEHFNGSHDHSVLLNELVTIDYALGPREKAI